VDLTSIRRHLPSRRRCRMSTRTNTPPFSKAASKMAGTSGFAINSRVIRIACSESPALTSTPPRKKLTRQSADLAALLHDGDRCGVRLASQFWLMHLPI
jgi:hypothetical protein